MVGMGAWCATQVRNWIGNGENRGMGNWGAPGEKRMRQVLSMRQWGREKGRGKGPSACYVSKRPQRPRETKFRRGRLGTEQDTSLSQTVGSQPNCEGAKVGIISFFIQAQAGTGHRPQDGRIQEKARDYVSGAGGIEPGETGNRAMLLSPSGVV